MRVKAGIIAVALALLSLLSGCSALRLAYNQAQDFTYWWLDGYVDFDGEQTALVRAALADWFAWHRATQLHDYADWLARVRNRARDDIDPAQACAWNEDVRRRLERAYERAIPAAAELALRLRPEQLQHIERRFAKANEEWSREHLQASRAGREAAALKRTLERAESFYGPLENNQRQWLTQAQQASPFDPQAWLAERQLQQQHTLEVLRRLIAERADTSAAQSALRALAAQAMLSPRPAYRALQQRMTTYSCTTVAQWHNQSTPAQRARLADKLKAWEDDLRLLTQAAAVTSPAVAPSAGR